MYMSQYDTGDNMNTISVVYTFATNTFATSTNGSANCAIIGGPSVEPYKDGWYRVSYVYHYTGGPSSRLLQTKYGLDSITLTAGSGLFYWGAQHEWNDKLTSFIPTTVGASTRAYDYLYCVDDARGKNLTSWFNINQGTVACEWNVNYTGSTANGATAAYSGYPGPYVFWKSDGDGANVLTHMFYADASTGKGIGIEQFNNNSWVFSQSVGIGVANNVTLKTTVGYSTNNHSWTVNGTPVLGGTPNQNTPPTTTRLDIGRSRANWIDGHIKTFKYWPTKLANTDILNSTLV
jgi:hypothetical protein